MGNFEILDPKQHRDLTVLRQRGADYGDSTMLSLAYPFEFRTLQAEYPILFKKSEDTGQFQAIALFGFSSEENLFLKDDAWQARSLPLAIKREPFLLAERRSADSDTPQDFVISMNMDHPRITLPGGDPLFTEDSDPTAYLQEVMSYLKAMQEGYEQSQQFFAALEREQLLTAINIDIPLPDPIELTGFYSVDEEQLQALSAEAMQRLQAAGWITPIYMQLASLSQMTGLIQKKIALSDPSISRK